MCWGSLAPYPIYILVIPEEIQLSICIRATSTHRHLPASPHGMRHAHNQSCPVYQLVPLSNSCRLTHAQAILYQRFRTALRSSRRISACLLGDLTKDHKRSIRAMRGISSVFCALAMVHGATGFVMPLPGRVSLQAARTTATFRAMPPSASSSPDRLSMSATDLPKFSVSLMDDTRVSLDMKKENLQMLAAQV